MGLLTKEIESALPPLFSQENNGQPIAVTRFVDTLGDWSWYAVEYDGKDLFFGLVLGFERELGYFSLSNFQEVNERAGFERIQRDSGFAPTPLSAIGM